MRARMLTSVFALALLAAPAAAQSHWLAAEGTSVALEFRHVSFEEDDDFGVLDGAWFLSGRFQVPVMGAAVVAELPFSSSSIGDGDRTIGNLYLGAELPVMLGVATIEAGARLPTLSVSGDDDVSTGLGFLSSIDGRYSAFVEDVTVLRLGARTGMSATDLISVRANLAGGYMIFSGDLAPDNDFVIDYGLRAFAGPGATRLGVGVEGFRIMTSEDDEDDNLNQLGIWLDHEFGIVRPGVSLFIPLDSDLGDFVSHVLGVSVEIDLPL